MATKAKQTNWTSHTKIYWRALKRANRSRHLIPKVIVDGTEQPSESPLHDFESTFPVKVFINWLHDRSSAFQFRQARLPASRIRTAMESVLDDIQSATPGALCSSWDILAASHRQSGKSGEGEDADDVEAAVWSSLKAVFGHTAPFDRYSVSGQWTRWCLPMAWTAHRYSFAGKTADETRKLAWIRSPEQILDRLEVQGVKPEERVTAVLFAETTAFSDELRARLLDALLEFIEQNRFSWDDDTITAVGSAIRKYAMNMSESEFEQYARLFLPSQTATLSCEIELELAKAVMWRMLYEPFDPATQAPELGARLVELATDYLKPRLILQKNYAAIVLDATLASILLDAPGSAGLVKAIADLKLGWFSDLLFRRMKQDASGLSNEQMALKSRIAQFLPDRE